MREIPVYYTYEIQNHPVIVNLMRRHGKDLNLRAF